MRAIRDDFRASERLVHTRTGAHDEDVLVWAPVVIAVAAVFAFIKS